MEVQSEALRDSWELSLHAKSPRTRAQYLAELDRFARWLVDADRPAGGVGDLAAVERGDVEAYFADCAARGLAQATTRSRWVALRSFYGWATDEQEVDADPLARVKVDKGQTPPPEVLATEQIEALLGACRGNDFYDRRDLALIRFLLATGLRASEAMSIVDADLDLHARTVTVRRGKGGEARVGRFDGATAAALDRYRRARARHPYARLPAFWIGYRGAMTAKGLPAILAKRADAAGIGHVHPHQLRHSWAHRLKAAGGSDEDLQTLGGWKNSEQVRRYGAHLAVGRALAAYDDHDPMAGL